MTPVVYLIPSVLDEMATNTIPHYIIDAVKDCQVIFAENERSARRFLKSICKDIVIDHYEWFTIHKAEEEQKNNFTYDGNIFMFFYLLCEKIGRAHV